MIVTLEDQTVCTTVKKNQFSSYFLPFIETIKKSQVEKSFFLFVSVKLNPDLIRMQYF